MAASVGPVLGELLPGDPEDFELPSSGPVAGEQFGAAQLPRSLHPRLGAQLPLLRIAEEELPVPVPVEAQLPASPSASSSSALPDGFGSREPADTATRLPGWQGLPQALVDELLPVYEQPLRLWSAFDGAEEAVELVKEVSGGKWTAPRQARFVAELMAWRSRAEGWCKRARTTLASSVTWRGARVTNSQAVATQRLQEVRATMVVPTKLLPKPCRWKTRYDKALASAEGPEARVEAEKRELQRLADLLAEVLQAAALPAADWLASCSNPAQARMLLVGGKRPRTVRSRLRTWGRYIRWLRLTRQRAFPQDIADLTEYVTDLVAGGCGRSIPGEFAAALSFIEKSGSVQPENCLSTRPLWLGALRQLQVECDSRSQPVKKARMPSTAMMLALELLVVNPERPLYMRAYAWVRLIKCWCTLRWDDVQHICPSSMRLDSVCFTLEVGQSKTTGPGRRTRTIHAHVHRLACFSGKDWLQTGFIIWNSEPFNYARTYLVPLPSFDLQGVVQKMALYCDGAAMGRAVLQELRVPEWSKEKGWLETEQALVPPEGAMLFTEHSERHWLPSLAAACGVDKSRRDYLGRWGIGRGSNDYVLTARQVVLSIQEEVTRWLCNGDPGLDESELLRDLRTSTQGDASWVESHAGVLVAGKRGGGSLTLRFPRLRLPELEASVRRDAPSPGRAPSPQRPESPSALSEPDPDAHEAATSPWWLSVSRRGHRRLHRLSGCGAMSSCRNQILPVHTLEGVVADDHCKHCWPGGAPGDKASSSDASGGDETESSSSDA